MSGMGYPKENELKFYISLSEGLVVRYLEWCCSQSLRSELMTVKAVMEAMALRLDTLERRLDPPDHGSGGGSSTRNKIFGVI